MITKLNVASFNLASTPADWLAAEQIGSIARPRRLGDRVGPGPGLKNFQAVQFLQRHGACRGSRHEILIGSRSHFAGQSLALRRGSEQPPPAARGPRVWARNLLANLPRVTEVSRGSATPLIESGS
jgi:hypothetical protein